MLVNSMLFYNLGYVLGEKEKWGSCTYACSLGVEGRRSEQILVAVAVGHVVIVLVR